MKKPFNRRGILAIAASAVGLFFDVIPARAEPFEQMGDAAVVEVRGPIVHETGFWCDSYDDVANRIMAAMSSSSSRVVLRIDSPGGDAIGCIETARAVRAMADQFGKPLHAFVDGYGTSAAYALACACDSIGALPSSFVGSIGCIDGLLDTVAADREYGMNFAFVTSGARKSDGCPHVAITDDAIAAVQSRVDTLASMFAEWVAERRGTTTEAVLGLEAAVFLAAQETPGVRLVDSSAATFEEFLDMVSSGSATARMSASLENRMNMKELLAALTKMAEGDGEDADKAKKMLAAMEGDDEAKKDDEPKKDEAKSEAEPDGDEPKKDEAKSQAKAEAEPDGDEPKKDEYKASSRSSSSSPKASAASGDRSIDSRLTALETQKERDELLAKRPDLMKDASMKAWLSSAPLATVRNAIKSIPKAPTPKPAAAAASTVSPVRAEGQQEGRVNHSPPEVVAELDAKMGLATKPSAIQRVGKAVVFAPMTREEARKSLAAKGGAK